MILIHSELVAWDAGGSYITYGPSYLMGLKYNQPVPPSEGDPGSPPEWWVYNDGHQTSAQFIPQAAYDHIRAELFRIQAMIEFETVDTFKNPIITAPAHLCGFNSQDDGDRTILVGDRQDSGWSVSDETFQRCLAEAHYAHQTNFRPSNVKA
jgi:hypothetical protein